MGLFILAHPVVYYLYVVHTLTCFSYLFACFVFAAKQLRKHNQKSFGCFVAMFLKSFVSTAYITAKSANWRHYKITLLTLVKIGEGPEN